MGSQKRFFFTTTLAAVLLAVVAGTALAMVSAVERSSTAVGGVQSNGGSLNSDITPDGHFVVFQSDASNLVAGDTNGVADIFRKDRQTGDVVRVSVADDESQSNGGSSLPFISADGNRVAFASTANNLVTSPVDNNGGQDIFVRDIAAGATLACSVGFAGDIANFGAEGPNISADGAHVIYLSSSSNMHPADASRAWNIYMRHVDTLVTERVSLADDESFINSPPRNAVCSPDGNLVAFQSSATNVVAGDTNAAGDIFVRNRSAGTTIRASITSTGAQGNGSSESPAISWNGRFVAFHSLSSNMVPGDTNGSTADVFVRDLLLNTTEACSVSSAGVFGNNVSLFCDISGDGRFIAYRSEATNLVASDTNGVLDVFLRDRVNATTERISVSAAQAQATGASQTPRLEEHGLRVSYDSAAANLVASDTNGARDVFVADIATPNPAAPTDLTATALTTSTIRLFWTDNSFDETKFRVERKTGGGAFAFVANAAVNAHSLVNGGLTPNTAYTYRVFAVRGAVDSLPSNEATATTNALGVPTNLAASSLDSTQVRLTWTDNFTGETGVQIWASLGGAAYVLVDTAAANATTYVHTGLSGNQTIKYKVRAMTATSQTDYSAIATAILMSAPTALNSQALNSLTINVKWTDTTSGETNYEVWRGVGAGGFTLLATKNANATQHTDTVPPGNKVYKYKVRAKSGTNFSSFSNEDASPAMNGPTNLVATPITPTRVDLTWNHNSSTLETGFQVYRRTSATGGRTLVGTTAANATSFSDTTVLHAKSYWYEVRALAGTNDYSNFSNQVMVTTP